MYLTGWRLVIPRTCHGVGFWLACLVFSMPCTLPIWGDRGAGHAKVVGGFMDSSIMSDVYELCCNQLLLSACHAGHLLTQAVRRRWMIVRLDG